MTGQVTTRTTEILDRVRLGTIERILHYLIVYEPSYHWRRGRLPFKDERELLEFIHIYILYYQIPRSRNSGKSFTGEDHGR